MFQNVVCRFLPCIPSVKHKYVTNTNANHVSRKESLHIYEQHIRKSDFESTSSDPCLFCDPTESLDIVVAISEK